MVYYTGGRQCVQRCQLGGFKFSARENLCSSLVLRLKTSGNKLPHSFPEYEYVWERGPPRSIAADRWRETGMRHPGIPKIARVDLDWHNNYASRCEKPPITAAELTIYASLARHLTFREFSRSVRETVRRTSFP